MGLSETELRKLRAVARSLHVPASSLYRLIDFESRWGVRARNPRSSATGLLQWVEGTAKGLGTSTNAIARMGVLDQLGLVERHLKKFGGRLTGNLPTSLYMAVFYPVAMGWGVDTAFPASVQRANPGIRTVGDYVARVEARPVPVELEEGPLARRIAPRLPPSTSSVIAVLGVGALLAAGIAVFRRT